MIKKIILANFLLLGFLLRVEGCIQKPQAGLYIKGHLGGIQGKSSTAAVQNRSDLSWQPEGSENALKGSLTFGYERFIPSSRFKVGVEGGIGLSTLKLNRSVEHKNSNVILNKRMKAGHYFHFSGLAGYEFDRVHVYGRLGYEWLDVDFKVHAGNQQTEALLTSNGMHRSLARNNLLVRGVLMGIGFSVPVKEGMRVGIEIQRVRHQKVSPFKTLSLEPIKLHQNRMMGLVKHYF